MQWYYSKNGTQLGPVEQSELQSKISTGEVSPSDLVWREGLADWQPAAQVAELRAASAPVGYAPPPPPVQGGVDSPYIPPAANPLPQGYPVPVVVMPNAGKATTSMTLGIISIVMGFLCGCLIGLPCGIIAIVVGNQFKREAELIPALAPLLGKAKAGILMGWIGIAVSVLTTILAIVINLGAKGITPPQ